MDIFNKKDGEENKEVAGFVDSRTSEEKEADNKIKSETTVSEENKEEINDASVEEIKEEEVSAGGGEAIEEVKTEEVVETTEEIPEEVIEEKQEEPEDLTDYVSLNPEDMVKLREEVNKLCRMHKGKFNFQGLKIHAKG